MSDGLFRSNLEYRDIRESQGQDSPVVKQAEKSVDAAIKEVDNVRVRLKDLKKRSLETRHTIIRYQEQQKLQDRLSGIEIDRLERELGGKGR